MKNIAVAGHSDRESCAINSAYLDYVQEAGLNPILITKQCDLPTMLAICDGLLLPGGIDIEPTFYREPNIASNYCSPDKDNFERKLMHMFANNHKKVFGICRGFQLIVREFMRIHDKSCPHHVFYQHINEHSLASARNVGRNVPTHDVKVNMHALYGVNIPEQSVYVNSMHHQALICGNDKHINITVNAHNKLKALAITDFSCPRVNNHGTIIIEAADVLINGAQMRGVQWHPEELMDTALLTTYFAEEEAGVNQANGAGQ